MIAARLCPRLCEFHGTCGGCARGNRCPRVHATIPPDARRTFVHMNWAWRSLEECQYRRHPSGHTIPVGEPPSAGSNIIDHVDSGYILRTRCRLYDRDRPPTHCAHFYYVRECQRAENCDFAHVVFINRRAVAFQLAPAPCAYGRQRQTQLQHQPQQSQQLQHYQQH